MFYIDGTNYMQESTFYDQINMFKNVTYNLNVGSDAVNIAAVMASMQDGLVSLFNLSDYSSAQDVAVALSQISYPSYYSSTQAVSYSQGLMYAYNILTTTKRPNSQTYFITAVSDSMVSGTSQFTNFVATTEANDTTVVFVGIQTGLYIADVTKTYFYFVNFGEEVQSYAPYVVNSICPCK